MIAAHGLRWILTVLFTATAVLGAARAVRPGRPRAEHPDELRAEHPVRPVHPDQPEHPDQPREMGPEQAPGIRPEQARAPGPGEDRPTPERITHALHAAMGTAMAVMVWPRGMDVPAVPQAAFFALATAWFVAAGLLHGRWIWRGPGAAGHPRGHAVLHAVMMGAMVWMLLAMSDGMSGPPAPAGSSGSMADMPGMPGMPGMSMSGAGGGMSMRLHGASHSVAVALFAVFVAMGLWWLSRAFDAARILPPPLPGPAAPGRRAAEPAVPRGAVDAGCHGAMALGMAVMLLAMT